MLQIPMLQRNSLTALLHSGASRPDAEATDERTGTFDCEDEEEDDEIGDGGPALTLLVSGHICEEALASCLFLEDGE